MADQRALDAIRRVEQALMRIESAASRPPPTFAPSTDPAEYERLREAHDDLRRRVVVTIGEIDRMIEHGEPR